MSSKTPIAVAHGDGIGPEIYGPSASVAQGPAPHPCFQQRRWFSRGAERSSARPVKSAKAKS